MAQDIEKTREKFATQEPEASYLQTFRFGQDVGRSTYSFLKKLYVNQYLLAGGSSPSFGREEWAARAKVTNCNNIIIVIIFIILPQFLSVNVEKR